MKQQHRAFLFLSLALLLAAPAMPQEAGGPYHYYLGRTPDRRTVSPRLHGERFAVFHNVGTADQVASDMDLEAPGWQARAIGGGYWTEFSRTEGAVIADVEVLVDQLLQRRTDYWFSPVLLTGDEASPSEIVVSPTVDVRFRSDVTRGEAVDLLYDAGLEVVEADFASLENVYVAKLQQRGTPRDVLAAARAMALREEVEWSEPNLGIRPRPSSSTCTNVTGYSQEPNWGDLWNLHGTWGVNAAGAYAVCGGGSASGPLVTIGILDDGVDNPHTDLPSSSQLPGVTCVETLVGQAECYLGGGTHIRACERHGTRVAGVAQMVKNSQGGIGIAPGAQSLSLKVHSSSPDALGTCIHDYNTPNAVAEGIEYARDQGVRVLNHSWNMVDEHSVVADAYFEARYFDKVISFAASGNDNDDEVDYPARYDSVNGVSALDIDGVRAAWDGKVSNSGPGVAFTAGGVDIFSTDRMGAEGYNASGDFHDLPNGTSYASPLVAGVAALAIAMEPSLRPEQVEVMLIHSVKDAGTTTGWDVDFGHGVPKAAKVVNLAESFLFADSFELYDPGGTPVYWEYFS